MKPSHLDESGAPRMVDVGAKPISARRAVARAVVQMRPEVLATLLDAGGPKGDALVTARLAGIGAAKRTSELIPLCHPLSLTDAGIDIDFDHELPGLRVTGWAAATGRTGVEMEALTAVAVALLTIYDMAKALDRRMEISSVRLLEKRGGKSGVWKRD